MSKKFAWTPSAVLPKERVSFADVSYEEMVSRAHALAPKLAARAEACEKLRRLPDDTERDLHDAGLFRFVQPKRVGGAELDVGIFVDVCAALARDKLADRVEDDTAPLLGTPEEIIARLKELEAGGATNILLVDPNASVRNLQAFAREVMPSFQSSRYAAAE